MKASGELEIWIFEEVVEEDEEFAHDGGEGQFCWLTGSTQFCVEGAENGIGTNGGESSHVENIAQSDAPTRDVALAGDISAVVIVGSNAEQRGGLVARKRAEFRAESQAGCGGDEAHALNFHETSGVSGELRFRGDGFLDGGFELLDLRGEKVDAGFGQRARQFGGLGRELDFERAALEHGLLSGDDQFIELDLSWSRWQIRLGLNFDAEIEKGFRVDGIGFGAAAEALGEIAHLARIGDGDFEAGGMSGGD